MIVLSVVLIPRLYGKCWTAGFLRFLPSGRRPAREWGENVEFISERIVNISDLESLINGAYLDITALRSELEKENPSMVKIDELSKQMHLSLLKAKDFEFCLEQRHVFNITVDELLSADQAVEQEMG